MKNSLLLMFALLVFSSCTKKPQKADLLVVNAKIFTVDEEFSIVDAMAIRDGRILATGSTSKLQSRFIPAETIDMQGKFIYPGFIDAHCHFVGYGLMLQTVDLRDSHSFDDMLRRVQNHAQLHPEGWVTGMGWDQNDWPDKRFPTNNELNALFPDKPVLLTRIDGHAVLANQAAIDAAQLNWSDVNPSEVIREDNRMSGVFLENAADALKAVVPKATGSELQAALLEAQKYCLAVGLTSVQDAGLDWTTIDLIREMQNAGELKMRIYAMLNPSDENLRRMTDGKVITEQLNVQSVKLYADGALGSRGAFLMESYSDDPGNRGLMVHSEKELKAVCKQAYENNYQVATHCIGDGAVKRMLSIYGEILGGENERRWRIEHAQVVQHDDFDRFGKYSVVPSVQTTHCTSDMYWAGDRLGVRLQNAYAYKRLLNQLGWLPNGSDFPIEQINPLFGFYAGVVRKDQKGWPDKGFQMKDALSREEALRSMTIWAAKAAFEEGLKGSLEAGKLADFVVLDTDLFNAPENMLFKAKVEATYLSGTIAFQAENN